jgi:hypothetical protein
VEGIRAFIEKNAHFPLPALPNPAVEKNVDALAEKSGKEGSEQGEAPAPQPKDHHSEL